MSNSELKIQHKYYPSTVGCGPCCAWQGAIDIAEAKIKLTDGTEAYALYRREVSFSQEVSYSVGKKSYFEKGFEKGKFIEQFDRLSDAKKSPYISIYRQLLNSVKEATKARKNEK